MKLKITSSITNIREAEIEVPNSITIFNLKNKLATTIEFKQFPERLILKADEKLLLEDNRSLKEYGISEGTTIQVQDQGLVVHRKWLTFLAYIGPFTLLPLFAIINKANSPIQLLLLVLCMVHYGKRLFESLFVHLYSYPYMPMVYVLGLTLYYSLFFGFLMGFFVFSNLYTYNSQLGLQEVVLTILFIYAEFKNGEAHWMQRVMQIESKGKKVVPRGKMFDWVVCSNYFWELVSWTVFSVLAWHWVPAVFTVASLYSMYSLGKQKHKLLKDTFADFDDKKAIIIPFIL